MTGFHLTQAAIADLKAIGRETQKTWGIGQRNIYLRKLDDSFHLIADNPDMGTACHDIKQGYRYHHVGRHVIFYRKTTHDIEIVRIFHDRMDYMPYLLAGQ